MKYSPKLFPNKYDNRTTVKPKPRLIQKTVLRIVLSIIFSLIMAETYPCPINIEPNPSTKKRIARIPKSFGESSLSNIADVNKAIVWTITEEV